MKKGSVVIITLVRKSLYPLVEALGKQQTDFDFEIILVAQNPVESWKFHDKRIRILEYEKGLGLAFYRNEGVKHANGEVVAFIDDDEEPLNHLWLNSLCKPILKGLVRVTTSGTVIPLKHGFLANSISLLGYPGGAALGFKLMWEVDHNNYTSHLCSGNFAIKKSFFMQLKGFNLNLKDGNEDVYLSDKIVMSGGKILYVEAATVSHLPRKNLWEFTKWHFKRGTAIAQYRAVKGISTNQISRLFKITLKILKNSIFSHYLPLVFVLLVWQYLAQFAGMLYSSLKRKF